MNSILKFAIPLLAMSILPFEEIHALAQMTFSPDIQGVTSVAWSPDGTHILSSGFDGTIRLWKADTCESGPFIYIDDPRVPQGEEAFRSPMRGVMSLAWSPDGKQFVAGLRDGTVRLYRINLDTPEDELFEEVAAFSTTGYRGLRTVAYSPKGHVVASAGHDNSIRLWEAKKYGSMIRELTGHLDAVETILFSHNAATLISSGRDGTIRTWDVATGQIKTSITAPGPVSALALSSDGRLVAGAISQSGHHRVLVWQATDWQELHSIEVEHPAHSLAFNRNGSQIATGGFQDTGTIWSIESGKPIFKTLSATERTIRGIEYSPNGAYLVAGTQVGTPILISASTGEIVRQFGKCALPNAHPK
jgi:WD40 repeat protein